MSRTVWGPPTWILIHTLAEKIKEEHFDNYKVELFEQIRQICYNLPCPECRMHATTFVKNININNCPNKEGFKLLLFSFHNDVNKRINNKIENNSILNKYKDPPIQEMINIIEIIYKKNPGNNQLMDAFHRHKTINNLNIWYNKHRDIFN